MDYFSAVRIYSAIELTIFTALVIAAVGGLGDGTVAVLGWTHGVGWILLCIAVAEGCRKHGFPWTAFAATVSPLGPAGSTAALEWIARSRRVRRAKDPAGQPAGG